MSGTNVLHEITMVRKTILSRLLLVYVFVYSGFQLAFRRNFALIFCFLFFNISMFAALIREEKEKIARKTRINIQWRLDYAFVRMHIAHTKPHHHSSNHSNGLVDTYNHCYKSKILCKIAASSL